MSRFVPIFDYRLLLFHIRIARDQPVLEYDAENRVVLSDDLSILELHAAAPHPRGKPMAGLFLIHQDLPIGQAIKPAKRSLSTATTTNGPTASNSCRCDTAKIQTEIAQSGNVDFRRLIPDSDTSVCLKSNSLSDVRL